MTALIGLLAIAMLATAPVDNIDPTVPELLDAPLLATVIPPASLSYGDEGAWVENLNTGLAEAGFHPDTGQVFGRQTRHAVYAFQKHHGLSRNGTFTAAMWPLLKEDIELPTRLEANRVEVDLGRQVLYLVEEGEVTLVLPVSSASGGTYRHSSGSLTRAVTPEGKFEFNRSVNGWRRSYLGSLYNPFYFRGGYAIHGSSSVPNYPASHGCVRLTMWDMDLIKTRIDLGWTIYVYGKRTEAPEPYVFVPPPSAAI